MDHPDRKNIRLKSYDYSQYGAYFITICTYKRSKILSHIVGGGFHAAPFAEPTRIGIEVDRAIKYYCEKLDISCDKYVIMPNHIHMIVFYEKGGHGNPLLPNLIGQLKSYTTLQYNKIDGTRNIQLWQRNFYDHIIRNDSDYQNIWQYIEDNPAKWNEDEYY